MFLSAGPQILILIITNILSCDAPWKESFKVFYSASAGFCCDVITCCFHRVVCVWLKMYFSSPRWQRFLSGVKEWGVGWENLHLHPIMGHKPLPDEDGVMKTDYHVFWQAISSLTPQGLDLCREGLKRWQDVLYSMNESQHSPGSISPIQDI